MTPKFALNLKTTLLQKNLVQVSNGESPLRVMSQPDRELHDEKLALLASKNDMFVRIWGSIAREPRSAQLIDGRVAAVLTASSVGRSHSDRVSEDDYLASYRTHPL